MNQLQLLKTRRFCPIFLTQFFGAFNDNFLKNALIILITYKATAVLGIPPAQLVAAAGGIFILPFFLFSAQAGQLADKFEKAALIRWVKIAEIGIMILAAVGFVGHRYEWLLACLFLMGCHSSLFGPLKFAILPQHLAETEIVGGNALVEAGTFLAILLGTLLGGILANLEPAGPRWIGIGLVAVAVVGWLTSLGIPRAEAPEPGLKLQWNPLTPTIQILRFTHETRSVFLSILGVSWFWLFGGAILSIFPDYCKDFLHADSSVVTLFLSTFSIGIALGSLFVEMLSRRHLELGLVPLGSIGMTLFAADLFWVGKPALVASAGGMVSLSGFLHGSGSWRILADLLGLSIFSGFYIVPLNTLIQQRSAPSHRSRIIAGNNILNALFMVWGAAQLMLMIRAKLSYPQIFLTLALMNMAVAVYIYSVLPEFFLRFLAWCLANVLYRLRVRGAENIPREGPAVLVCNHVSFVDWMIIAAGVGRPIRFIMAQDFAQGWIMKRLVKQAKIIPIASARENPQVMEEAFRKAAEELRAGELVCIFPEGKITHDGKMNPFKPGIERLIRETPVPVVPLALVNLWGSYFSREGKKTFFKRPKRLWSRIQLRIGSPVPASSVKATLLQSRVEELLGTSPISVIENKQRLG